MTYVPVSTMRELRRLHKGSLHIELFGSGGTIVSRACRLVESHDTLSGHRTSGGVLPRYENRVRRWAILPLSAFTRNNQKNAALRGPTVATPLVGVLATTQCSKRIAANVVASRPQLQFSYSHRQ